MVETVDSSQPGDLSFNNAAAPLCIPRFREAPSIFKPWRREEKSAIPKWWKASFTQSTKWGTSATCGSLLVCFQCLKALAQLDHHWEIRHKQVLARLQLCFYSHLVVRVWITVSHFAICHAVRRTSYLKKL